MNHPDRQLMERAIALGQQSFAKNKQAVGALIVRGQEVITEGVTTIHVEQDSTCHAEMNAIRSASKTLGSRYLEGCYLYTTFEPCPMCTTAAIWAKMEGIVYGASHQDQTPQEHWRIMIPAAEIVAKGEPKLILHEKFMRKECKELLNIKEPA